MDVFIVHQIEHDGGGVSTSFIVGVSATEERAIKIRDFYKTTFEAADVAWEAKWVIEAWAVDQGGEV